MKSVVKIYDKDPYLNTTSAIHFSTVYGNIAYNKTVFDISFGWHKDLSTQNVIFTEAS